MKATVTSLRFVVVVGAAIGIAACGGTTPPSSASSSETATAAHPAGPTRRYQLKGQILIVNTAERTLSINHEDIVGFMPAMTMSYPVANAELMNGRTAGELIEATLEVTDSAGRLVEIVHKGQAPLPAKTSLTPMSAGVLEPGAEAPDAALIDQNDKRRSFSEWRGHVVLLTFIYTRCPLPNFCPLMDRNFVTIQRAAAADPALQRAMRLVSVSFDPDFDTPAVLKQHAAALKADPALWTFLTADRLTVERFAAKFGVGVVREGTGPGDLTHNLRTVLIGADGKIVKIYSGGDWSTSTVLADLRAAAASGK